MRSPRFRHLCTSQLPITKVLSDYSSAYVFFLMRDSRSGLLLLDNPALPFALSDVLRPISRISMKRCHRFSMITSQHFNSKIYTDLFLFICIFAPLSFLDMKLPSPYCYFAFVYYLLFFFQLFNCIVSSLIFSYFTLL